MLINYRCLRLSKSDEIDDIGEDFHESVMCRSQKIREGEVVYATLDRGKVKPSL